MQIRAEEKVQKCSKVSLKMSYLFRILNWFSFRRKCKKSQKKIPKKVPREKCEEIVTNNCKMNYKDVPEKVCKQVRRLKSKLIEINNKLLIHCTVACG